MKRSAMYVQHLESQRYYSSDTELIHLWVQRKAPHIQHSCWLAANEFRLFVRKPLAQVTPADVRAFAVGLKARKVASQSYKQKLSAVTSLLTYGGKIGMLPTLPWEAGVISFRRATWELCILWCRHLASYPYRIVGKITAPLCNSDATRFNISRQQKVRSLLAKFLNSPVHFGLLWTLCVALFFALGLMTPRLLGQVPIAPSSLTKTGGEQLILVNSSPRKQEVAIATSAKKTADPLHLVRTKAFLDTIAVAEGTDTPNGYRTQYTGTKFSSFRDHPRELKCDRRYRKKLCADAAGRYQFLSPTWDRFAKKIGIKNFTPANQDRAALALIREKGALEDVEAGRFEIAARKVARVWPSLHRFGNGSLEKSMPRLKQVYQHKLESISN